MGEQLPVLLGEVSCPARVVRPPRSPNSSSGEATFSDRKGLIFSCL